MTDYTYEVIRTDAQHKVMEVRYRVPGLDEVDVGMPLPAVGQTLDERVQQYAPAARWEQAQTVFQDVPVGSNGAVRRSPSDTAQAASQQPQDAQRAANAEMWANARFEQAVAAALVKFGVLAQDPTAVKVTKL